MSEEPKNGMHTDKYGNRCWYRDGKLFRMDGDAGVFWFQDRKFHREDGPAREWCDGACEWWLNGKQLSKEAHAREVAKIRVERLSTPEAQQAKLEEIRDRLEHILGEVTQ